MNKLVIATIVGCGLVYMADKVGSSIVRFRSDERLKKRDEAALESQAINKRISILREEALIDAKFRRIAHDNDL